jgi:hypothetical protein
MSTFKSILIIGAMLQMQPTKPQEPPMPPVPAKVKHTGIPHRHFGNYPQWPRRTLFLTLTNRPVITTEGTTFIPVSPAEWSKLLTAFPDDVTTNNLSFYQ